MDDFDHGLNTAVKKLRHALGDSVDRPRFVETIAQRGYRWVAPVRRRPAASPATILARHRLDRPPTPRLHRAPLVGRDAELARIERALARGVRGRGGVVVLTGEAGIGKTRLLDEVAVRARRSGLRVLTGRCTQGDWARAYVPFAEALAQVVDEDPAAALRDAFGPHAPVLTTLVSALPGRLAGLQTASPLRPDEERKRLLARRAADRRSGGPTTWRGGSDSRLHHGRAPPGACS